MPKNSLFGTVLENADTDAAERIDAEAYEKEETTQRLKQAQLYDHKLPDRFQRKSGKSII